jgi:glycosyltransferase involved in cell wall biosynthesis
MKKEHNVISEYEYITVCLCTYKRPHMLVHLLHALKRQKTDGLFTFSIVVVDNDHARSAEKTVATFGENTEIAIGYFCEPEQNIALARNRAVINANGNLLAFIDDDEIPIDKWLLILYRKLRELNADGVLGPVKPKFEATPPGWVVKGKICERDFFKTGTVLDNPRYTRTGNVLLSKKLFDDKENLFNKEFGKTGGEDVDFFRRMIAKGHNFIWCNEAPVYEFVSAERLKRKYFIKRALLRGHVNSKKPYISISEISKSVIAVILYTIALPFLNLIGHHLFMKCLIKDCDHFGKILGIFGINLVESRTF